jgi:hypothetical protein
MSQNPKKRDRVEKVLDSTMGFLAPVLGLLAIVYAIEIPENPQMIWVSMPLGIWTLCGFKAMNH